MFTDNPVFDNPANEVTVWRYMDLSQFIYLLTTKTLRFSRLDEVDDDWEGAIPKSLAQLQKPPSDLPNRLFQMALGPLINCWHENERESIAMWTLYTKGTSGIAIRSTVARIKKALKDVPNRLQIARVQYIDHATETVKQNNAYLPFVYKRQAFEHEREIRLLLDPIGTETISSGVRRITGFTHGENVVVDVSALIQKVVISPQYPMWGLDALTDLVRSHGVSAIVSSSETIEPYSGTAFIR